MLTFGRIKILSVNISQANEPIQEANDADDNADASDQPDASDSKQAAEDAANGNENDPSENGDDNGNDDDASAKDAAASPEMEIKGIVQGEADDNVVQSAGQVDRTQDFNSKV